MTPNGLKITSVHGAKADEYKSKVGGKRKKTTFLDLFISASMETARKLSYSEEGYIIINIPFLNPKYEHIFNIMVSRKKGKKHSEPNTFF